MVLMGYGTGEWYPWRPRAIAIVLLTALLGVVFAHPMAQGRRPAKISPGLRARVASGARVPVIIELRAQPDDAPDLPRAHAIARGIARARRTASCFAPPGTVTSSA
jgi:hypothetical protein